MSEAVIDSAKEYAQKQGVSLSSLVENFLKNTTGVVSKHSQKQPPKSKTPITDELVRIIEKNQRTPEEIKAYEEDLYKRKPYMKELMEHYERKHG